MHVSRRNEEASLLCLLTMGLSNLCRWPVQLSLPQLPVKKMFGANTLTRPPPPRQRAAYACHYGGNGDEILQVLDTTPSLAERRCRLTEQFFTDLLNPTSCLHALIPAKRDSDVTSKLRVIFQFIKIFFFSV